MTSDAIPSAKKERLATYVFIGLHWHLERPGSFQTVITTASNKPEVNQTKPEQAAEGSKICADSAGYAPQALVPLYDVN
jgi:hypothetical protein